MKRLESGPMVEVTKLSIELMESLPENQTISEEITEIENLAKGLTLVPPADDFGVEASIAEFQKVMAAKISVTFSGMVMRLVHLGKNIGMADEDIVNMVGYFATVMETISDVSTHNVDVGRIISGRMSSQAVSMLLWAGEFGYADFYNTDSGESVTVGEGTVTYVTEGPNEAFIQAAYDAYVEDLCEIAPPPYVPVDMIVSGVRTQLKFMEDDK